VQKCVITEQCFHWMCSFSWGGFFLAVARVVWRNRHVDGCQSRWSSIVYHLFFTWGVCGLRRCRYATQLVEILVVLSRLGVVWDFFHYHCHITLNGGIVVRVHCIVVYLCGSILYRKGSCVCGFCSTETTHA